MSHNLQKISEFQKCQVDNLVDFEKCCKTRIFLQRSAPMQPEKIDILPKICQKFATTLRVHVLRRHELERVEAEVPGLPVRPLSLAEPGRNSLAPTTPHREEGQI